MGLKCCVAVCGGWPRKTAQYVDTGQAHGQRHRGLRKQVGNRKLQFFNIQLQIFDEGVWVLKSLILQLQFF